MNRSDLVVAVIFIGLGVFMTASAYRLPPGIKGSPGPGFFPGLLGVFMIVFAAGLMKQSLRRSAEESPVMENKRTLALSVGLILLYLLLWGSGTFLLRTAVFLTLLLRVLGEGWKRSVAVAAVMVTTITLGFYYGLRLTLE